MSTETLAQPSTSTVPRKFTAVEFVQMYEAGILAESERVELLEGEIFTMSPIGPLHMGIVNRLTRLLVRQAGDDGVVSVQNSVLLDPHSLPQPDFALLKPRADDYTKSHAQPADVLLLIEVAQTSLAHDRRKKLPLYAAAGVPEVWIVNLNQKQIEQFSQPHGRQYKQHTVVLRGEAIAASLLPAVAFGVDQLFSEG
jgi:Uma2 family endonuclease